MRVVISISKCEVNGERRTVNGAERSCIERGNSASASDANAKNKAHGVLIHTDFVRTQNTHCVVDGTISGAEQNRTNVRAVLRVAEVVQKWWK